MKPVNQLRKAVVLVVLVAILPVAGSCRSRTDKTAGPVVLTFGNITGVPNGAISVVASEGVGVIIGTFTLQSVVKDPNPGTPSALEDVEVTSYQVIYKRRDSGTRVPPPLIASFPVEVPVNGTGVINNLPVVRQDQLLSPPLGDLINPGHDTETGTAIIVLDAMVTFFGQTISGDKIQSPTATFTFEFVP
ncbi:MAG TPA: hypothetical protein VMW75_16775 [Thermoanaerobaculia bacterium]|nr:hypothetical protein [Thermoanaerobaculia bacterium]